jgi:hypothetical protein
MSDAPLSKARTTGAQPSDCTANIRAWALRPAEPFQSLERARHADQSRATAVG